MDEKKRGDDAQDHAPAPSERAPSPAGGQQDAPNYDERTDGGRAIKVEDMSSANDEGAS